MIARLLLLLLLLAPQLVAAADDPRMHIELLADENTSIEQLHSSIGKATERALPILWNRVVVQGGQKLIPANVKAIQFLQRATPSEAGVIISFDQHRVLDFLKMNSIPHIASMPKWRFSLKLSNSFGNPMPESAAMLEEAVRSEAEAWGYRLDGGRESLLLHWQWQDDGQVAFGARGTSRLGEYTETRTIIPGDDPFIQLKPWLSSILLKTRDAYASSPEELVAADGDTAAPPQNRELILNMKRRASLPEQVLFEDELRRDPRIIELSLKQINRDGQQYRITLKGSDDQWLPHWFNQRGLNLTPSIEGWVVQ